MAVVVSQNLKIVYAISLLDLLAVGLTYPLLYPHVRSLGASHIVIGFLGSAYSGLQFFSGPLIGSWSDVRGIKSVLIISLLLSSVCYFLLGLTSSIVFITFVRILLGCVKHTHTLCRALIGACLPREQQAEAWGFTSALGNIGFIIGPIIGGHVSELHHGFYYVCCITSFLFIINAGLALILTDTPKETQNETDNTQTASVLSIVRQDLVKSVNNLKAVDWKIYGDAFCIRFLFGFAMSIYFSNQALYLTEKYDLSQKYVGYAISLVSFLGATTGLMLGYLTKKLYKNDFDCTRRLLHFLTVLTVSLILLYLAPNVYTFVAALVPFAISSIIVRIVSMELILTKSNDKGKGSVSGASNSIMSLSRFVSPISSGIIGDIFGQRTVMLSAFVPAFLATLVCFKINYSKVKQG